MNHPIGNIRGFCCVWDGFSTSAFLNSTHVTSRSEYMEHIKIASNARAEQETTHTSVLFACFVQVTPHSPTLHSFRRPTCTFASIRDKQTVFTGAVCCNVRHLIFTMWCKCSVCGENFMRASKILQCGWLTLQDLPIGFRPTTNRYRATRNIKIADNWVAGLEKL